ncbi:response regulator [Thioalkalivibrio thiocyanodenitrificans]|uniref:response regulator n=1 Tax=Thioalkalivibrio thiocyanodenitrificans TaxID=243063 RepID=UPI0003685C08|nr:response regulator [Thioalkalivibrio thiocyanodenitrificans]
MSRSWRIKHRLFILALLPAVVVGIVLTAYWSMLKVQELESRLVTRGNTIAGFLAPVVAHGVTSGNDALVRSVAAHMRSQPDLVAIRVFDRHGNPIYTHVQEPPPSRRLHVLSERLFGHGTRAFEAPVLSGGPGDIGHNGGPVDTGAGEPRQVIGQVRISLSTIPTAIKQTEWILRSIAIILGLLAITAVIASRLERPLSRTLEEMADTVHRIGRGELDARLPVRGGGELEVLANGINRMVENLRQAHARMTARVQASTRDLQDQLKLIDEKNRALTVARTQAEEANVKKSRLLANISHELRTPLSAIQGYTELLAQQGNLDERQQGWLGIINASSRDTLKLVNELLDVSRLESGRMSIHKAQFDLGQCLAEVIGICRRSAHGRRADVTLLMDPQTPERISSDNLRFKQVITNVLSNALKFTRDGRVNIHTGVRSADGRRQLEIGVRDFGPGINRDDLFHIFEPFFQAGQAHTERPGGGAGLGLSITRGIVGLLGGRITVDSTPGTGSLFTIFLPLDDADVPPAVPLSPRSVDRVAVWSDDPEIQRALLETLEVMRLSAHACRDQETYLRYLGTHARDLGIVWVGELPDHALTQFRDHPDPCARTLLARRTGLGRETMDTLAAQGAHLIPLTVSVPALDRAIRDMTRPGGADTRRTAAADPGHARLDGYRFLVADDNTVNRRLLTELIQRHGGKVEQAGDGDAAVRAHRANPPDLVFMDVHMPGKDGMAALEEIRAADATARVVAVTADLRPEMHIALLQHGFDNVLYKPVSEDDLLACVEDAPHDRPRAPGRTGGDVFDAHQPVHDNEIALQRAGGNPRLARDMLQMLIRDVERVRAQLGRGTTDAETLGDTVHRIHGGARCCGTVRLAARSHALEAALKGGQPDRLEALKDAWIGELDALLEQGDALLRSLEDMASSTD